MQRYTAQYVRLLTTYSICTVSGPETRRAVYTVALATPGTGLVFMRSFSLLLGQCGTTNSVRSQAGHSSIKI